jgi:dUTP pyrophosphatase
MELKLFKLHKDVPEPKYGSENAACFDLSAFLHYQGSVKAYTKENNLMEMLVTQDTSGKNYIDIPGEWRVLIPTGLIMDIPCNHSVRIYPRSGISTKQGLNLINCVGIIDSDYVHEVFIPVYNTAQKKIRIYDNDRIAQGEMVFNYKTLINFTNERPLARGNRDGGFGSTGIQ